MTPDDILAKVRKARVRAEKHLYRGDAAHAEREIEWLDIIEGLVARVRELEQPALPPSPPPGKMRVTASVPVTYDVTPGQIAAYLRSKGWKRILEHLDAAEYYMSPGDAAEVVIPIGATPGRYAARMLEHVAAIENRSTGEVLRDIAAMEEA